MPKCQPEDYRVLSQDPGDEVDDCLSDEGHCHRGGSTTHRCSGAPRPTLACRTRRHRGTLA